MAEPLKLIGWGWKITQRTLGLRVLFVVVGDETGKGGGSVVIKEIIYSMKLNYGKGLYKKTQRHGVVTFKVRLLVLMEFPSLSVLLRIDDEYTISVL
jgi:hypothetical protein